MSLDLVQLQHELKTQDNAITADPLFVVYQKVKVYGIESDYGAESMDWIHVDGDYEVASARKHKALERYYEKFYTEPRGWKRGYYVTKDVFATACLTRKGAEAYLKANGHNLKEPYIYVESLFRNEEMKSLREELLLGKIESRSKLSEIVQDFIQKQEITCPENIYQSDRVIENAYEFIEKLCKVVGYHEYEEDDED